MGSLVPISEIPTISLLYRLGRLKAATAATSPVARPVTPNQTYNNKIALIQGDVTKLQVDSIVNAANGSLLGGGGVDGAIHRAAGPELLRECETLDGCDTGDAKITRAYELPCKRVIHAVGPIYRSTKAHGKHTSLLQGCYHRCLELAVEHKLRSIAFVAISTGVYGYPSGEAAEAAIAEVRCFLESGEGDSLDRIIFCNFLDKDVHAYHKTIPLLFPPTEEDIKSIDDGNAASGLGNGVNADTDNSLAAKLPDPPKTVPGYEDAPDAKRLRNNGHSNSA